MPKVGGQGGGSAATWQNTTRSLAPVSLKISPQQLLRTLAFVCQGWGESVFEPQPLVSLLILLIIMYFTIVTTTIIIAMIITINICIGSAKILTTLTGYNSSVLDLR